MALLMPEFPFTITRLTKTYAVHFVSIGPTPTLVSYLCKTTSKYMGRRSMIINAYVHVTNPVTGERAVGKLVSKGGGARKRGSAVTRRQATATAGVEAGVTVTAAPRTPTGAVAGAGMAACVATTRLFARLHLSLLTRLCSCSWRSPFICLQLTSLYIACQEMFSSLTLKLCYAFERQRASVVCRKFKASCNGRSIIRNPTFLPFFNVMQRTEDIWSL